VELRQLKAFVAVATEGHFGRAARRLNLTQPGLTLRIQALEKELGAQLFERSAREVQLTAAGAVLLPHAKSLLRIQDRALGELKDQAEGIAGRLRISYLTYGGVAFPAKLIAAFRNRYPTMRVETTTGTSASNTERLRDGLVDAAFIHPGFVTSPGGIPDAIAVRLLRRDNILLAMSPNHHLAKLEQVPVRALRNEPLIMFPTTPYHGFNLMLQGWLARHIGAEPKVVANEPPEHAMQAVAGSSSLIAFAEASRASNTPVPGIAYRRMAPDLLSDFGIAYFRDDESPKLANLLKLIDEISEGELGEIPEGSEVLYAPKSPAG
jgi:DNA-binding transcriptional LysR family regulator